MALPRPSWYGGRDRSTLSITKKKKKKKKKITYQKASWVELCRQTWPHAEEMEHSAAVGPKEKQREQQR